MLHRLNMLFSTRRAILLMVCVLAASQAYAADEAMLFRIFLTDGSSLVRMGIPCSAKLSSRKSVVPGMPSRRCPS